MKMKKIISIVAIILLMKFTSGLNMFVVQPSLDDDKDTIIFENHLEHNYNDEEFNDELSCRNG